MGGDLMKLEELIRPLVEKDELLNLHVNEHLLKRYLCAFKSTDVALERLIETNRWRREFEVSKLHIDVPGIKRNHLAKKARVLNTFDKSSRPIIYIAARNHSMYNRNLEELTQYIVFLLEEACCLCQEELADNLCIIFDLQEFSISCMDYSVIKTLIWVLNRHYPERLGVCFVVNAPLLFTACWSIIQKWMDDRTRSKVHFVSTLQDLEPYLDVTCLPSDL